MERREGIPDMYIYDCSVNKCGLKKNTKNCLWKCLYCALAEGNEKKKAALSLNSQFTVQVKYNA